MKEIFGKLDTGATVYKYWLKNEQALVGIITFGAAIQSFSAFGVDIVGGYDDIESYIADDSHQGAVIGRVANRIGGASFVMDGTRYCLPKNDGDNCLHGGEGFDRRIWDVLYADDEKIRLGYTSADGEEGFPSAVDVTVEYTLKNATLTVDYVARPQGKTPIALTNHAYFNLDGFGADVLDQTLQVYADSYTDVDESLIPNGNRPRVEGTPYDFREPRKIGEHLGAELDGYDNNFILTPKESVIASNGRRVGYAARVAGRELEMRVYTDQVGLQVYTGNFLGGKPDFKGGIKRIKHGAICLEAQTEPNCINSGVGFYSAGEEYRQTTVYAVERLSDR